MSQPINRFGKESYDKSDDSGLKTEGDRASSVRARLKTIGGKFKRMQIEAATLLVECRDGGYWAHEYSTFANYVERELGITMRTAQEMMRVIRKCAAANVPSEKIAELGWSKVALIATDLTKENAAALMAEVENKTYSQLQESKRQMRKKQSEGGKTSSPSASSGIKSLGQPVLTLSESILKAIQCASLHTRDISTQANLEFMASAFMDLCPPPPRVPENPNWN